jgi:hypothetical protein
MLGIDKDVVEVIKDDESPLYFFSCSLSDSMSVSRGSCLAS